MPLVDRIQKTRRIESNIRDVRRIFTHLLFIRFDEPCVAGAPVGGAHGSADTAEPGDLRRARVWGLSISGKMKPVGQRRTGMAGRWLAGVQ